MKKRYSAVERLSQSDRPKKSTLRSTSMYTGLCCSVLLSLLCVSACSPDPASENSLPNANASDAEDIEENIRNSYALLAAKRPDICPKLLQKNVDDDTIVRTAEVLISDYCDYYLYPEAGQSIDININSDQIETLLIVPTMHNFANGPYQVQSYDKHVIRLNYVGATHKPTRLSYDVNITITS
ncbi:MULTISPECIES: hypothetical protein [unclassified Psychrobacter]|jgi:hypothetical protein|uniref:hypothetical protein n=1 Tax=unclassified Psychrobacter TaxID=196806 RepID=UPI000C32193B|nr:hypothetical protein [Psychrobacter sp. Sarcosine-3u-12]PKG34079.1 hypothetical protein CXF65_13920 [Psychrobacter sp. Sarcosine-3u-12]